MENKKDNTLLIILLVVIIILLSVFGFLLYLQNKDNSKVNNNQNNVAAPTNNNQNSEVNTGKQNSVTIVEYTKEKIDEKTNRIRFEGENDLSTTRDYSLAINNLKVDFGFPGTTDQSIKVNDNEIGTSFWYPEIYTIDDTTIFVTGGTDIRSTTVYLVNKNGELIKKIYNLDPNYSDMVISGAQENLVINKEGLKFKGTRGTHGPTIYSLQKSGNYSSLADIDLSKCSVFNKYAEEVMDGTYEMKYLGNSSWGELTNTGYTLLKDTDIKCN